MSLIIFANFRINNEERYLRMQDSFLSFKDISAKKWVINIRGSYKEKTFKFLNEQLGDKLYHYELESKKGWFHDTRQMLGDIDSDFVFFWIEDHINIVDIAKYDEILVEMKDNKCEHLVYSWWHDRYKRNFHSLIAKESKNLSIYTINEKNIKTIKIDIGHYFYIISAASIISLRLFKKVILSDHPTFKRWSKETPFDFEKRSTDVEFLPFIHALSKYELFVSIDDNQVKNIGYCLIDRGLYPNRMNREEIKSIESNKRKLFDFIKPFFPKSTKKYLYNCLYLIHRLIYTLK